MVSMQGGREERGERRGAELYECRGAVMRVRSAEVHNGVNAEGL